jgi:hypothetical protein
MITLHVLKLLEDNGYGTLMLTGDESNENSLWFEKLPLKKTGVYIMSRGDPIARGSRISQTFDLYARGTNDVDGAQRLEAILDFFTKECYPSCLLPAVPGYSEKEYKNTIIVPSFNVNNVGVDATDRVIYQASAQIIYNKEN